MMLTIKSTGQMRAARALLRWSAQDLAAASGIGVATIRRIEAIDGTPSTHTRTLLAIQAALESAGIEFIGSSNGSIGVVLHEKKSL